MEQISSETGTPLLILQRLNPCSLSSQISLTREQPPTLLPKAASPLRCSSRRSPRQTTHYVKKGYVCECPHVKRVVAVPAVVQVDRILASPVCSVSPLPAVNPQESPVNAISSPSIDNVESPLFVAEDEPLRVTRKQQPRSARWSPYPAPPPSPHRVQQVITSGGYIQADRSHYVSDMLRSVGSGVVRRTARSTRHYVKNGFVCECPHMRRVC